VVSIDFAGKTAIVTGSSQGLGETTARLFHQAGANVVVNYFSDPEGVNKARAFQIVESLGDRAVALDANVSDEAAVNAMFRATVDRFGRLDFLINNAGIIRDKTIRKMSMSEWEAVISVNLTGVFTCCKAAAEHIADGGRIVNLSSITSVLGFFGTGNYSASKAGVIGLTKVLCREWARRAVTVNAVAPGVVLTDMGLAIPESSRQEMLKQVPLGRFGEPKDVAGVILFLCSDLASYMTGQVIHVSGGWT
jgi:3-oxoacyl-[acyl-carrier protein] reductase